MCELNVHVCLPSASAAVFVCLFAVLCCLYLCVYSMHFVVQCSYVQYILRRICIHQLPVCSAEGKYVCVSLCFVCTCVFIESGWRLQILMSQLWEVGGGVGVGEDKNQAGSSPLKLMTVCLSE